jgi:hypothetical protein
MRSPARRSALLRALAAGATVPVVSAMGVLSACTVGPGADHDGPQAPRAGTLAWPEGAGRRMAWVFSSGGPRCFVHVGVVKALEQMGVQPDAVVGASGGALIAAMVAARWPAAEIERVALDVGPTDLVRLSLGTDERFSGNGIAAWVNELLRERARTQLLEELPLPASRCRPRARSRTRWRRCGCAACRWSTPTSSCRCRCAWRAAWARSACWRWMRRRTNNAPRRALSAFARATGASVRSPSPTR